MPLPQEQEESTQRTRREKEERKAEKERLQREAKKREEQRKNAEIKDLKRRQAEDQLEKLKKTPVGARALADLKPEVSSFLLVRFRSGAGIPLNVSV